MKDDEKDKMVGAIRGLQEMFTLLDMSPGAIAGCLTFYVKYLCHYQPNPEEAEREFVQKLAAQTLPDFEALKAKYAAVEAETSKPSKGDMN